MTAIFLHIKVIPNASTNQIIDYANGTLRLRIKGVPEKGKVNEELIAFLAKELRIAKSNIEVVSGLTSRLKRLKIEGIAQDQFNTFLNSFNKSSE